MKRRGHQQRQRKLVGGRLSRGRVSVRMPLVVERRELIWSGHSEQWLWTEQRVRTRNRRRAPGTPRRRTGSGCRAATSTRYLRRQWYHDMELLLDSWLRGRRRRWWGRDHKLSRVDERVRHPEAVQCELQVEFERLARLPSRRPQTQRAPELELPGFNLSAHETQHQWFVVRFAFRVFLWQNQLRPSSPENPRVRQLQI